MLLNQPQMLWALLLLGIPILVHLLRLRKYRKTPFTNVRVLQRLVSESNKSSTLKKWLLLLTRLALLTALILAFAQPYKAQPDADARRDIVLYLDNSFSMQAPIEGTTALEYAVQELLQNVSEDASIRLVTHDGQYKELRGASLRETLLSLEFSHRAMDASSLGFRAASLFDPRPGSLREFWMISDFEGLDLDQMDTTGLGSLHAVPLAPDMQMNMSIDSAWIRSMNPDLIELEVATSLQDPEARKPLSLYNGDTLIAKSAPELDDTGRGSAVFSLPANEELEGTIRILDDGLAYDNNLYFSISEAPEIRVLSIGPGPVEYLQRLYGEGEFNFTSLGIEALDYALLPAQHLLILNELNAVPEALSAELAGFLEDGGSLMIIPGATADLESYNQLLGRVSGPKLQPAVLSDNRITTIALGHPLYRDVFESEVGNFEYPSVRSYFPVSGGGAPVLEFQNGSPFLSVSGNLYLFTAALNQENSNFRQSPLVVPTLYNIGRQSLPFPELYFVIGQAATFDIDRPLEEDRIFRLEGPGYSFIPRQQRYSRKTRMQFGTEPIRDGHYRVSGDIAPEVLLSFNYPRDEGTQNDTRPELPEYVETHTAPSDLIERYQNDTRITSLWKWFVILALIFAVCELVLQKVMR